MVIGGGIAGITAAIDLGNAGREVLLVESLPSIGGRMLQLSETFPTLDCAQCTLTPKTVEAGRHPKIRLLTYSEVEKVSGSAGAFDVTIRRKAAYIDRDLCTGCGLCQVKCPAKVASEFDRGTGIRKAVYTLSPQAVPNKPVIDPASCRQLLSGKCGVCAKICPIKAIDYTQREVRVTERVGAIVVAVGYDLLPLTEFGEYGAGTVPDVIDGLAFERLNSASGPTSGELRRPSDGTVPKEVVFISCTGSRDPARRCAYCSRVCCMYTAKHARLYRHKVHDGAASIFFMDVRACGKGYEEFVAQAMEDGVVYLRGRVSALHREGGKILVRGVDTLIGRQVELRADMVVLATAMVPRAGSSLLAGALGIATGPDGFLLEANRKTSPAAASREGIFLAGCASGPKDIPDAVAHGGAAAAGVLTLFSRLEAGVRS